MNFIVDHASMQGVPFDNFPRFPSNKKLNPLLVQSEAPDVFYDIDMGPKAGVAAVVQSNSFSSAPHRRIGASVRFDCRAPEEFPGPGHYDPSSPTKSSISDTARLGDRRSKPSQRRPSYVRAQQELRDVVMEYSRQRKQLQSRQWRRHVAAAPPPIRNPHSTELGGSSAGIGPMSPIVDKEEFHTRLWSRRPFAQTSHTLRAKGFTFGNTKTRHRTGAAKSSRTSQTAPLAEAGRSRRGAASGTPGPGQYDSKMVWVRPLVYKQDPRNEFRPRRHTDRR